MNVTECMTRARGLMNDWQLEDWELKLSNTRRLMGTTSHREHVIRLSRGFIQANDWPEMQDTVLHEIAHALAGPQKKPHGAEWRQMARLVGAKPSARNDTATTPPSRYVVTCPSCDRVYKRNRLNKAATYHCPPCGPLYGKLNWQDTKTGQLAR